MVSRLLAAVFLALVFLPKAKADLPDFTGLIANNSPAVVKIRTVQKVSERRRQQIPQGEIPEIFRDFFGQGNMPPREASAIGSGFLISSDGYILTNNHVVGEADKIIIRLSDRREYEGSIIGTDVRSDLALLKIDETNLPTVKFAQPNDLKVGEWVVAIGSPFGLDYSASAGIISAIGRSIPTARGEDYVPFIQSDVAINPGNSGGPLFNLRGEVVGINSQIFTRSGGSIGLSFAIPINVATAVVAQLKEKGHVERGWLGVYIQDVDKTLAESLSLDKPSGALIAQVEPGSPSDKAGLEAGDVVVKFHNRVIDEASDLPHVVGLIKPGTRVSAEIIRKGKKRTVKVTVGTRPGDDRSAAGAKGDILGLVVDELSEELQNKWRLNGGVVISKVYPDTAAEMVGLEPGDIIVQLGYRTISSIEDYNSILEEMPSGTPVALRFFRRGRSVFRTIEIN